MSCLRIYGYYFGGEGEYLVYSPKKMFKETKLRRVFLNLLNYRLYMKRILSTPYVIEDCIASHNNIPQKTGWGKGERRVFTEK